MAPRKPATIAVASVVVTAVLLLTASTASAAPPRGTDRVGAYTYRDERATAGPDFGYRNTTNVLTFTGGVDEGEANVDLPFAFPFYGQRRTSMTVSPNGAVVFPEGQDVNYINRDLGHALANQAMIAPLWDDWVAFGQVRTGLSGTSPNRVFTVHWATVSPFDGTLEDAVDFQMQLFEKGGHIEFHYHDVDSNDVNDLGVSATVGIDNGTTSRLQYSFDAASLVDDRAIRFSPVRCNGQIPTITGGFGADAIMATPGSDVIAALSGNDTVHSLGGNDLVCGGTGNDTIRLGAGNDRAEGQKGNDRLDGGAGNDVLRGGPGRDVCLGRRGLDVALRCEAVGGVP